MPAEIYLGFSTKADDQDVANATDPKKLLGVRKLLATTAGWDLPACQMVIDADHKESLTLLANVILSH